MPAVPDPGAFLKKFIDNGSCQCFMLRRACEENSITTEGMSWLSENIGSCPKCHKALMSAEPKVFTDDPSNLSKMLDYRVILLTIIPQNLQKCSIFA